MYAQKVSTPGVMLHPVDLLLLSEARKKHLMMIACNAGDNLELESPRTTILNLCPSLYDGHDAVGEPDLSNPNTWIVVFCHPTEGKCEPDRLLHFMPGWHKQSLGETEWQECIASADMARASILQDLHTRVRDASPDCEESLFQELHETEARFSLQEELQKMNVYVEDVLGDGNCGLWSLIELMDCGPKALRERDLFSKSDAQKTMRNMRKEPLILNLWKNCRSLCYICQPIHFVVRCCCDDVFICIHVY